MPTDDPKPIALPPAPILLVDDRAEDLAALTVVLEAQHIEVHTATSAASALRALLEKEFAVILLDVHMPDVGGFDLAGIIKQRERSRETPILFLTAASMDMSFLYRAYSVGAVDFLSKPIDREVVRAKVGVFVELFRKEQRIRQQEAALREADQRERDRQLDDLRRLSDERYRNLAEAVPQIVWTADRHGTVTYYNRRWQDFTGIAASPPMPWTNAVHPDDLERASSEWRTAVASGAIYEGEVRLSRADGAWRWHLARAVPERDADGTITGWLGTHTDHHDLKTTHEEAEAARVRATYLAEASALLSSSLDLPATLQRVARLPVPRIADWCAVEVTDPEKKADAPTDLLAVAHLVPEKEQVLRQLATRSSSTNGAGWLPAAATDGTVRDSVTTAFAQDDEHLQALRDVGVAMIVRVPLVVRERTLGVMTFGVGTTRKTEIDRRFINDLAQHAALAVDNARLYLAAQLALKARDEFLSIASHELRTPLTALQLQLQSLRRVTSNLDANWDPARQRIDSAARQASRLAGLTERLLDVSRIAAGRLKLDLEEFDLAEAVKELTERFQDEAAKAGCKLNLEVKAAPRGWWDRLRVEQIVSNLLSNALKYGRGGAIDVVVEHDHEHAMLTVNDHGIGISEADIKRIFERFERAVPSRQYGGLGIGLYVARQIVEAHGGQIRVESRVGVGSRFTIALPIQPTAAAQRENA